MIRRRLDQELVRRRLAESRAAGRKAIDDGRVRVAGVPEPKPATMVDEATALEVIEPETGYASRGGIKLAAALAHFGVSVRDRRALDAGAGHGGFTDCLLQHGAVEVTAVDVGYGQLAWHLRTDPRVVVYERTNLRHVDPGALGAPFDVITVDLSFISLGKVAAPLAALGAEDTDYLALVKPQFEVGREQVGKGGIVRDPALHAAAVRAAASSFSSVGLPARAVVASPIPGAKGNREFFLWLRGDAEEISDALIDESVMS